MNPATPEEAAALIVLVRPVPATSRYKVVLQVADRPAIDLQGEFQTPQKANEWAAPVREQLGLFARAQGDAMKQTVQIALAPLIEQVRATNVSLADQIVQQVANTSR